jgi:DNA (cytosine-5)-methyltransferase 1
MRHGSLFSGIGGFDLAAEWMGWENVFHCEWNPFGQKVLNYYWPKAISYHDITKTDFSIHRGSIDILTGGFPCQPYSAAGKRLGKEDERHLWPEMLRAIREIQPTWIVGENVLGLVNWNGGLVFEEVQADLEAEGYEVQPYVLPACAVNAPHRRDRVWFVAYSKNHGCQRWNKLRQGNNIQERSIYQCEEKGWYDIRAIIERSEQGRSTSNSSSNRRERQWQGNETQEGYQSRPESNRVMEGGFEGLCSQWTSSNAQSGREGRLRNQSEETGARESDQSSGSICGVSYDVTDTSSTRGRENNRFGKPRFIDKKSETNYWSNFPTQSPICLGNDGFSSRLDSITFPKWRNESIKAGGNAIVPQVVYQIFKAIEEYDKETN